MQTYGLERRIDNLKLRIGICSNKYQIGVELATVLNQLDFLAASNSEVTTFISNSNIVHNQGIVPNGMEVVHDGSLIALIGLEIERLDEFILRWEVICQLQACIDNIYLNQYRLQQLIDCNKKTEYDQLEKANVNYSRMIKKSLKLLKFQIFQAMRLNEDIQNRLYKLRSYSRRIERIASRSEFTCTVPEKTIE